MKTSLAGLMFVSLLLISACGKDSSGAGGTPTAPTTPTAPANRSPTITSMSVTPSFGISGLSGISMTASATDADNDALTYQWSYGATTVTGASVAATLTGDGNVVIRLTVSDGRGGSATDSRTVVIGTASGNWNFLWNGNACGAAVPPIIHFTQTSTIVTGTMDSPGAWCGVPAGTPGKFDPAAPGSINAQGNVTGLRLKFEGYLDVFLTLTMDTTGRTMTGTGRSTSGQVNSVTLVKQ